ncbi:FMN-dependent NADH-azoreductase [Paenibacillus taihuensis]|uniref:FMN-dependent NADH-azoreductase n=1 Tax=Paenibacillus taihuensis TaxID=1156355 RepID=A0A3D9RU32_9BACL|nr:hypothetical protein [Paenibacillus taihuensis]REE81044.1 FMN-dependent NADH-azoreductase [Paenibacillus taihuensis]
MKILLVINAPATVDSPASVSLEVGNHFMNNYRKMNPSETIGQIDLYSEEINEDYQIIRAQGTNLLDKSEVLDKAKKEAEKEAAYLSSKVTV